MTFESFFIACFLIVLFSSFLYFIQKDINEFPNFFTTNKKIPQVIPKNIDNNMPSIDSPMAHLAFNFNTDTDSDSKKNSKNIRQYLVDKYDSPPSDYKPSTHFQDIFTPEEVSNWGKR